MRLKELIQDVEPIEVIGDTDVEIVDISYHTKMVREGSCFVAITGNLVDGHNFAGTAVERGASAIVSSKAVDIPDGVPNVIVKNTRKALALMSSRFFGEPSKHFRLVGVTGTNGKTTITFLMESIFKVAGCNPGVVGTINYRYGSKNINPCHTTPESYDLQKLFREMLDFGVNYVAMEVSSHSLDQSRVYGCHFDGAVFTNLTQDHLDYHFDMKRYMEAKSILFKEHLPESAKKSPWAAINIDDNSGFELAKALPYRVIRYSLCRDADVFALDADYTLTGTHLKLKAGSDSLEISTKLIGRHNASNILGAVAAAHGLGIPIRRIKEGIEAVQRVPGRLDPIPNSKGVVVLVDYAHTPDALKNVTSAIKELKPRRLITVFGCGGDRDKTKRPLMGYEAALTSDILVITSDNPRSENPRKIIEEIVAGVKKVGIKEGVEDGFGYVIEEDRRLAIKMAIGFACEGDVVLIAGKGHENYQVIGSQKRHFNDFETAKEYLKG